MTDRKDLVGRYACRLCRHDQWEHNLEVGCPHCTCMATPGEAGARTDREAGFEILPAHQRLAGYGVRADKTPAGPGYDAPELILHMPDIYDPGGSNIVRKSRFATSVATAATSIVRYLEWPGDRRSTWRGRETALPSATEHGPFAVYRIDRAATEELRAELSKMDGSKRMTKETRKIGGVTYEVDGKADKGFAAEVRAAVKRAIR